MKVASEKPSGMASVLALASGAAVLVPSLIALGLALLAVAAALF